MKSNVFKFDKNEIFANKKKYATLFSEDNKVLEEILMMLWKQDIYTVGCCKGHDDKEPGVPYIGISLYNDLDMIVNILSNISKDDIRISFVGRGASKSVGIHNRSLDNKNNKKLFADIMDTLKRDNFLYYDNDIKKLIDYVISFGSDYINIHLYYNKSKRNVYFITDSLVIINKLKKKYDYNVINEKCHLYSFFIVKEY